MFQGKNNGKEREKIRKKEKLTEYSTPITFETS